MIDMNQVWVVQEAVEYVRRWRRSSPGARIHVLQFDCGVKRHASLKIGLLRSLRVQMIYWGMRSDARSRKMGSAS